MKKSTFLFLMLFMHQQIVGLCQTNVGGTLTQNTVWNLVGSPYTLTSVVGVLPGITLTIQPGVQIIGNFDIVIRGGTLLMSGAEGQRIKVQGCRILFKSSDLSKSSIAYVDFDQAGVQLGDENEFNQDNVKNSNTLLAKNATLSNNSFCRTKGYQTTAKLRFELSAINNSIIIGYYPRSEPIELDAVNINNTKITSDSYNFGIKVTNSIVNNTSFLMGCCDANFDIFDSEINNSSFREGSGQPVNGLIRLDKVNFTETYFSLPSAKFLMTNCTAKISSSIPVFIYMGNGEIKNSSIEGSSSTTLFKVSGMSGYNVGSSVVFQNMNFNVFGTAIEILNFGLLTISQNNFLSASNYNLKNTSSKDITAIGNYWGTNNEQTIKDKIYDIYDNINSGLVNYGEFLQSKVPNALPIITWANPADIEYGTTLGIAQLNATSSVDGSFLYAPASGTKLNVGNNQRLSVTFIPTDAVNYTSVTKKVIINVNKGTPLIVWPNPSDIVYGTLLGTTQLNATSSVEGTFSYTPAIGTKLNLGGNQSLSVLFTPTDLANYKSSTKQVSINVIKAPQTITFTALSSKTFGDAPFILSGTSSSGLALTYTSSNTSVATVSGNTVTIVGAGTANITAKQAGNSNYNPAVDVAQSLTVNKASQTITFTALSSKTFGDASFTLSGTSSSGLAMTYVSSNTDVATISGNTVTIVGAGTATLTAKQAGNNNYDPAVDVAQSLTVNKASQTTTFAPLANKIYGDVPFVLSGTSSSGLTLTYTSSNTAVATVSGNTVTILRAGTTTITAGQAGDNNYLATADKQQVLTINKAQPSLSWPTPADIDFGTSLNSTQLNATSSVSGSFTYVPTAGTNLNIGSGQQLSVTFTPTDVVNYNSATKQVFINVNKIAPAITWSSPADIVYGTMLGATQLNATASVNGTFSYTPATGTKLSAGVNPLSVTFTPTDAVSYRSATKVVTINVSKATPAVSWSNPADIVYGTPLSSTQLNATTLVAGTFSYTPAIGVTLNAGNGQQLLVTFVPTDAANYLSTTASVSINVTRAQLQISFAAIADKTLGNEPFILTASSNSTLPVIFSSNSDKISIANSTVTLLNAGRVSITASQVGNENHNVASSVTQSFCIKPAKPTVTISNLNTPTPLLTSNASSGNQWYADGTVIAGATSATFSATKSGSYKVQVTVDDCIGEFSEEQPLVITSIEAIDFPVDLYPNPVSDALTIYFGDLAGKKQVTIFALTGESLVSNNTESSSIAIDVSDLSTGMYLAKVIAGGPVQTKKFKKQ